MKLKVMMVIQQYNVMSKTKKVTVSMTEETKQKALDLSVLILGTENISGYISYLINKAHLEAKK